MSHENVTFPQLSGWRRPQPAAMRDFQNQIEKLAERVGFVPRRDEPASRAAPEDTYDAKAERSEELAERVGFEPTVRFPAHKLSRLAP